MQNNDVRILEELEFFNFENILNFLLAQQSKYSFAPSLSNYK